MIFSRKMLGMVVGVVILIGLIKTWPLPVEPKILDSLKIYSKYIVKGRVKISDLLGPVDVACAVGPYDNYDARFSNMLTTQQMIAANDVLNKRNEVSSGDNRFFLVGLRGEMVASIYESSFFAKLSTVDKSSTTALDCVDGDGFVSPEKFNDVAVIKLIKGV